MGNHMSSDPNLFERFHADTVAPGELLHVFLNYFQSAVQPRLNEVLYRGGETTHALKVCFAGARIRDIIAGPGLTTADVDFLESQVASELLGPSKTDVASTVMFSASPVQGWFRYRDSFQILPAPEGAPRPHFLLADHPFILQFEFPACSNPFIHSMRMTERRRQLSLVLAGLLAGSVKSLVGSATHHWVISAPSSGEVPRAGYMQEGYWWPGLFTGSKGFKSTEDMAGLQQIPAVKYYFRFGIEPASVFDIPDNFVALLDQFGALSAGLKDQFLRACYWCDFSNSVIQRSRSAAFMSLVSAVEALMPPPHLEAPRCPQCRRSAGSSITSRFADFIEQMVPTGQGTEAVRKRLYQVRSALSHGGRLLHSDRMVGFGLSPDSRQESEDFWAVQRFVKVVLVNWLATAR
jgi:hypothetical protein